MVVSALTCMLDEAARLRDLGFGLCRILPSEKVPHYRGWTRFSLEPDQLRQYPSANMGILGGALSNDLVVVDPDRPEIRAEAARRLPRTMTDGRASGPGHLYYRVTDLPPWARAEPGVAGGVGGPKIMHFTDAKGQPIGLDFLGTGAQAVCPPSLHQSGERRCWIVRPEDIVTLPYLELWAIVKRLAKDFGAANTDRENRTTVGTVPSPRKHREIDSHLHRRATRYLARCRPAVSGQGGHNATMWAARVLVYGFDLGVGHGFELLQEYYNPRCEPPWNDAELMHKCEDADTKPFDKPRGWLLDGAEVHTVSERFPKPLNKVQRCTNWLRDFLTPRAYPSNEIKTAALAMGFTLNNLKEAKAVLAKVGLRHSSTEYQGAWWSGFGEPSTWQQRAGQ